MGRLKDTAVVGVALLGIVSLTAQAGEPALVASAHADTAHTVLRLADGRWQLTEIRGPDRFPRHPADIFEFDGKGLSGKVGCNWISASAVFVGGIVRYSDPKQTTMSCRIKGDPEEGRRIQIVGAALDGGYVQGASPARAEIVSRDKKTTLVFRRAKR
jgi:hypothetical protein